MTIIAPPPTPPLSITSANPNFSDNGRRARYGVSYLRTICAQAGVGFDETSTDEDNLAVDATVQFARTSVRVQVKCTSTFRVAGKRATLDLEPSWVSKWTDNIGPVYVVMVKVPTDIPDWIAHNAGSTQHRAIAYWVRFDPNAHTAKMTFTSAQRLTVETLYRWRDEVYAHYDAVAGGGA